jgi:hypothetical protein
MKEGNEVDAELYYCHLTVTPTNKPKRVNCASTKAPAARYRTGAASLCLHTAVRQQRIGLQGDVWTGWDRGARCGVGESARPKAAETNRCRAFQSRSGHQGALFQRQSRRDGPAAAAQSSLFARRWARARCAEVSVEVQSKYLRLPWRLSGQRLNEREQQETWVAQARWLCRTPISPVIPGPASCADGRPYHAQLAVPMQSLRVICFTGSSHVEQTWRKSAVFGMDMCLVPSEGLALHHRLSGPLSSPRR